MIYLDRRDDTIILVQNHKFSDNYKLCEDKTGRKFLFHVKTITEHYYYIGRL